MAARRVFAGAPLVAGRLPRSDGAGPVLRGLLSFAGTGPIAPLVLAPCRLDALCVGGFLAITVRTVGLERVARVARSSLGPLLGAILAVSAWNALRGSLTELVLPLRGTLIALAFGAMMILSLAARPGTLASRLLRSPAMTFLGTRSYGLYVFHGVIAYWMVEHRALLDPLGARVGVGAAVLLEAAAGAGVSLAVAAISYEVFEKRFLRLKGRLAPAFAGARTAARLDARSAE